MGRVQPSREKRAGFDLGFRSFAGDDVARVQARMPEFDAFMLDDQGLLRIHPAEVHRAYMSQMERQIWCHYRGIYGIPTVELVAWFQKQIGGRRAIEIGSGNGALGRALGIPRTDKRLMEEQKIADYYAAGGQPVTTYPDDVEKMDALDAVRHYKPDVVVASWVSHYLPPEHTGRYRGCMYGVKEPEMLERIQHYVMLGNVAIHQQNAPGGTRKPIFSTHPYKAFTAPWVVSRTSQPELDRLWIWTGAKAPKRGK